MSYIGDSNRPHEYHLQVAFNNDDAESSWRPIDTRIRNLFASERTSFWTCSRGRKSKRRRLNPPDDDHDELRRRHRRQDMSEYDSCTSEIPKTGSRGK